MIHTHNMQQQRPGYSITRDSRGNKYIVKPEDYKRGGSSWAEHRSMSDTQKLLFARGLGIEPS